MSILLSSCIFGITLLPSKQITHNMKGVGMIQTAVIPAAGLGTRFLPFTKSVPKEMLPLISKPAIQYIIEESVNANLPELFIIIGKGKKAIIDHFNPINKQETLLKEKHINLLKELIEDKIAQAKINYLWQPQPKGLGHAILMARNVIPSNSYFAVLLPDDILVGNDPAIGTMAKIAEKEKATVIAVQEVPQVNISSYGVISIKQQLAPDLFEVDNLVEKPSIDQAPSNLAIVGRYIIPEKIFGILDNMQHHVKGELQLTDAIQELINQGEKVIAYKFSHKRFDTGTPQGWLEAIIHFGLNDAHYAQNVKALLKKNK